MQNQLIKRTNALNSFQPNVTSLNTISRHLQGWRLALLMTLAHDPGGGKVMK